MDQGNMIYFGPWNANAQQLLSKVLPTSHLLAAAGGAEERREKPKPKPRGQQTSTLSLGTTNIKDQMGAKKKAKPTSLSLTSAIGVYAMNCGVVIGTLSVLFFLAAQTSRQMSDYWVRQWTGDLLCWYPTCKNQANPVFGTASASYVTIYGLLVVAFLVLMLFRGTFFHWWTLGGSNTMYNKMLHRCVCGRGVS